MIVIDGIELTQSEELRFHADSESREGEYFPSADDIRGHVKAGDVSRSAIRSVSRDAIAGSAPMECEAAA